MKRLIILIFLLTILPLAQAAEIKLTKETTDFDKGETLISTISGNFIDQVKSENILFYQDHVRIPMDFSLEKINEGYYLSAQLANKPEGNYSVRIEGVRYMKVLEEVEEDIIQNFTISNQTADFAVTPGFASLSKSEDLSLDLQSFSESAINIETKSSLTSLEKTSLQSGELKRLTFDISSVPNETQAWLNISSEKTSYSIPLFVEGTSSSSSPTNNEVFGTAFKFEPNNIDVSLATDSSTERIIYLVNYGSETIDEVTFSIPSSFKNYVSLSPKKISNFEKDDIEKITISINSNSSQGPLSGTITATSSEFNESLSVSLSIIQGYIPPENQSEENKEGVLTTCAQLEGTLCTSSQSCSGETISTSDKEICCLSPGICKEPEAGGSTGKIIGWSIIVLAIGLLFWFFKKYKKVRPKVDILKIGQGKK